MDNDIVIVLKCLVFRQMLVDVYFMYKVYYCGEKLRIWKYFLLQFVNEGIVVIFFSLLLKIIFKKW